MPIKLHNKEVTIIAEVKTKSPFGFISDKTWDELFVLAEKTGDMLSIHTDPRWGGSFDLIKKAKTLTNKPILAKGIHALDSDIEQAIASGADMVLVVGRTPSEYLSKYPQHRSKLLIEPHTLAELTKVPPDMHAAWNSRDLATGGKKTETFAEARKIFSGWLCQASNIGAIADIQEGADAVLVGQQLAEFTKDLERSGMLK